MRINLKTLLTIVCIALLPVSLQAKTESFGVGDKTFLLNGKPFHIKAAEIHYPRIPRPYWEHRIKMCKALGMNTICLYVFWNIHEQQEGQFDFTGNNDLRAFIQLAQKNGMYVILRPGPYVCAEWEMGGLPWWLLKKHDIQLRKQDPYFMERLEIFEQKVGEQVADLTIEKGGPIIMVQVENEYGAYDVDKEYIAAVRDILKKNGFDKVQLFQCDWSSTFKANALDDLIWTMNFGTGANIENEFAALKAARPHSPLMCSEFWSGWFDKWGSAHETRDAKSMVDGLETMIQNNISFSLYMTHGGTSWGHWAGANSPGIWPDVTSYDYDAPINEAGQTTPKYYELRNMMAKYHKGKLPAIPAAYPTIAISDFKITEVAPLSDNLPTPITSTNVKNFEDMDMGWGCMLYRTTIKQDVGVESILRITEAHDYVQVFLNGRHIGTLNRMHQESTLKMPAMKKGDVLDIYVDTFGRINFGRGIKDHKGITEKVELSYEDGDVVNIELKNWQHFLLPDDYASQTKLNYVPLTAANTGVRGNYRGTFTVKKPGDTFIDMSAWGKGQVYINGHAIGRFWSIGPQQTLYMPGCWLKKGVNEIIITDVLGPKSTRVEGKTEPVLDAQNKEAPATHRTENQTLDLTDEKPVNEGTLTEGNGWKEVKFGTTAGGRYVCIEALSSHWDREYACIAEFYLLDEDGNRLNRDTWKVLYADDEDVKSGNKSADKIFDLQESTYWSTNKGIPFPHTIVIDLGQDKKISGFQILPRVEQGAPEAIKDYRFYVKSAPFKGI